MAGLSGSGHCANNDCLLPISTADKTNVIGGIPIIPIGDTEKIKSKEYN